MTLVCPIFINTGMFQGAKGNSFILPVLDQEKVSDRIILGIKRKDQIIALPNIVHIGALLKYILPIPVSDVISDLLGITTCMDHFKQTRSNI